MSLPRLAAAAAAAPWLLLDHDGRMGDGRLVGGGDQTLGEAARHKAVNEKEKKTKLKSNRTKQLLEEVVCYVDFIPNTPFKRKLVAEGS